MRKIRKNDTVVITSGRDKGKRGTVLHVLDGAYVVSGINTVKRAVKPNPMKNEVGGFVSKEAPIAAANVAIFNSNSKKADRVGFVLENDRKRRTFKSTGQAV